MTRTPLGLARAARHCRNGVCTTDRVAAGGGTVGDDVAALAVAAVAAIAFAAVTAAARLVGDIGRVSAPAQTGETGAALPLRAAVPGVAPVIVATQRAAVAMKSRPAFNSVSLLWKVGTGWGRTP